MRILLDTNIFIPLEDSSLGLSNKLAELSRLAAGKHLLLVHPASYRDIMRDKNDERRERMLERLSKYNQLESPPELDPEIEKALFGSPRKDNDSVDNLILYGLTKNCVHWLVTEDEGIHRKARKIDEHERVLSVDQAIVSLLSLSSEEARLHPYIEDAPCHTVEITNPIFDSLRIGYGGEEFNKWYIEKCCQSGRNAWVCRSSDVIHSICIYKTEHNAIVTNDNVALPGKSLKLCTFKVASQGYKLGELMLKQAFNFAVANDVQHVYATVEPEEHEFLENLLIEFGFSPFGTDIQGRDTVYVKVFPTELPITSDTDLEYAIKYYPSFRLDKNTAYLVPIQPQYHEILFPELRQQNDLFVSISNSAGNSIKQAYLCKSPCKAIKPGDILFFYRTHDEMAITTNVDPFVETMIQ